MICGRDAGGMREDGGVLGRPALQSSRTFRMTDLELRSSESESFEVVNKSLEQLEECLPACFVRTPRRRRLRIPSPENLRRLQVRETRNVNPR